MEKDVLSPGFIRFGTFELDLQSGELRKGGVKLKLTGQPFQVLVILLEQPGAVVSREELQKRLWPDTFVDVDHNLNTAINKIREVLGDSAESPRFVETLPRRGYRFIGPIDGVSSGVPAAGSARNAPLPRRSQSLRLPIFGACVLLAVLGFVFYLRQHASGPPVQRALTRLTFDDGLQTGATWSPDGRFIAYSSDRGGKFDIWVQQVTGGDPVQITKGSGHNWQPGWSPDGKYIAYRSEEGEGGLYIVPALGGEGLERKIARFGYYPRWSPDSSQILFQTGRLGLASRFYVVGLDGNEAREVLSEMTKNVYGVSAAWHPDGKRITVRTWDSRPTPIPQFWTAPIAGGPAVLSEVSPEIMKMAEVASGAGIVNWADSDFSFSWTPAGKAIYFERSMRGATNLWRMNTDPETLRVTGIERLTTGPGSDAVLSVSPDGSKIAFTAESKHVRVWLFPFDATRGRILGLGHAVSSEAVEAWEPNLSVDGKNLAFCGRRLGEWDLWLTSLSDGHETQIGADDYTRDRPQWSPDGTQVAYTRVNFSGGTYQLMLWSSKTREEEPLTDILQSIPVVYDWSLDGRQLLVSIGAGDTQRTELWLMPVNGAPHVQAAARKIVSDAAHAFYQPHFSPDGRWIVFEAVKDSESSLYVMPAAGGPWTLISKSKHWDDKPRWAPDGRSIYYVSERGGFYNVWGVRFDPAKGVPLGEPFQITTFGSPNLMIADTIPTVELSLTQDRLVITVAQVSGSIWMLDNVDK